MFCGSPDGYYTAWSVSLILQGEPCSQSVHRASHPLAAPIQHVSVGVREIAMDVPERDRSRKSDEGDAVEDVVRELVGPVPVSSFVKSFWVTAMRQGFPSGRHLACFLGLTPREHSSGRIRRLGAISKRGDAYLRMLLIHGARGVLAQAGSARSHDRLRVWALDVQRRRGHNKATVALANKLARLAWVVWRNDTNFQEVPMA